LLSDIKPETKALPQAYWPRHYTLAQVGEYFGVNYATVS